MIGAATWMATGFGLLDRGAGEKDLGAVVAATARTAAAGCQLAAGRQAEVGIVELDRSGRADLVFLEGANDVQAGLETGVRVLVSKITHGGIDPFRWGWKMREPAASSPSACAAARGFSCEHFTVPL